MRHKKLHSLVRMQHGLATRKQLLELGYSSEMVNNRVQGGALFPVYAGVYAVGRPELSTQGYWLGAVLSCGPDAFLSHQAAGSLWRIVQLESPSVDVSVPKSVVRRRPGVRVHRRGALILPHVTVRQGIRVTTPLATLVDLATVLSERQLEVAVLEADKWDLIEMSDLERRLERFSGQPGIGRLRKMLASTTLVLTDSELERLFLRLVAEDGLPAPSCGEYVNGFKVDFVWPDLGLVVETDGLRYHRNPSQQARDRLRDQVHTSRGLTTLRFTHFQVKHQSAHVSQILRATVSRLAAGLGLAAAYG